MVDKSARRMRLLRDGAVAREYAVSLGTSPVGHKQAEGDERTPEGVYTLDRRTDGCVAITNAEMDEFGRVVPVGTPIEIRL